jgi:hypothetical protein
MFQKAGSGTLLTFKEKDKQNQIKLNASKFFKEFEDYNEDEDEQE